MKFTRIAVITLALVGAAGLQAQGSSGIFITGISSSFSPSNPLMPGDTVNFTVSVTYARPVAAVGYLQIKLEEVSDKGTVTIPQSDGPEVQRLTGHEYDSANQRHATAIEVGGLTVVSKAP